MNQDLAALFAGQVWAMERIALERLIAQARAMPTLSAAARPVPRPTTRTRENVAIIPLHGAITFRPGPFDYLFGFTSLLEFTHALRQAAADKDVDRIIIDVDSPGGTLSGLPAAAEAVRRVATTKPVIAVVNETCASAAYWIACQASEVVSIREGLTGSIGVYITHIDVSKALGKAGVQVTYVSAGKYKTEGAPEIPLGDTALGHIQELVDDGYRLFVTDVARGRGTTPAEVRAGYGEGRVLPARAALAAKLIDRIVGELDDVVWSSSRTGQRVFAETRLRRLRAGKRDLTPFEREQADRARRQLTGGTR